MRQLSSVLLVMAVGLMFFGFSAFQIMTHQLAVGNTEQVNGVVLDNGVVRLPGGDQPTTYKPWVEYSYEVGNETYVSENVYPGFGGKSMSFRSDAEEFLDQYEINDTVTVYVKTSAPQNSFLVKTGLSIWMFLFMAIGLGLIYFGGRSLFRS